MSENEQQSNLITIDEATLAELEATRIQSSDTPFDRRLVLTAGQTAEYHTPDGVLEYVTFDRLRVTGLNARVQSVKSGTALSVAINLVADGFETGTIEDDGTPVKHDFLREERYSAFRDPSKQYGVTRIAGSAWIVQENLNLFLAMVNGLLATGKFTALRNPKNHPDSERTTQDRVRLIPHGASADRLGDSDYGYAIQGIEMQVNPNYARGHRSFTSGLDEQVQRIEAVQSINQSDVRRAAFVELLRNVNYVSGATPDQQGRERPRQLDIGKLFFGDTEFALYQPGGNILSAGLFDDVITSGRAISEAEATGAAPTVEEMSEADLGF